MGRGGEGGGREGKKKKKEKTKGKHENLNLGLSGPLYFNLTYTCQFFFFLPWIINSDLQ